jgi:glucose/mannose-6-phosphate isomerase
MFQSRILRYERFIFDTFFSLFIKNEEYVIESIAPALAKKLQEQSIKNIYFVGMGCSAIVADALRGFFRSINHPISIEVVNDFAIEDFLDKQAMCSPHSLFILTSYSGCSHEPKLAYEYLKHYNENILALTSGGELMEIAKKNNLSLIKWSLTTADREYPLFHVPQYVGILLNAFFKLGILKTDYSDSLVSLATELKQHFTVEKIEDWIYMAKQFVDRPLILISTSFWSQSFLKLALMHLNEIAMVMAHRNSIHEFGHSEVASLSGPKKEVGIFLFRDECDQYTNGKFDLMMRAFNNRGIPENYNIKVATFSLDKKHFLNS